MNIQKKLLKMISEREHPSVFYYSLKTAILDGRAIHAVNMIRGQLPDNREMLVRICGKDIIETIEEILNNEEN